MLQELGTRLAETREEEGRSLAAVAGPAKISATYLQKLEHGEVGSPSPRVLRRLATALDLPYLELMTLAGFLSAEERHDVETSPQPSVQPHPLQNQKLTPDEWRAVGAFLRYLKEGRK